MTHDGKWSRAEQKWHCYFNNDLCHWVVRARNLYSQVLWMLSSLPFWATINMSQHNVMRVSVIVWGRKLKDRIARVDLCNLWCVFYGLIHRWPRDGAVTDMHDIHKRLLTFPLSVWRRTSNAGWGRTEGLVVITTFLSRHSDVKSEDLCPHTHTAPAPRR